jgi:hypothetical protein
LSANLRKSIRRWIFSTHPTAKAKKPRPDHDGRGAAPRPKRKKEDDRGRDGVSQARKGCRVPRAATQCPPWIHFRTHVPQQVGHNQHAAQ